nr:MAG TPA: hypothetical protein [Bacteriophage sp.]
MDILVYCSLSNRQCSICYKTSNCKVIMGK